MAVVARERASSRSPSMVRAPGLARSRPRRRRRRNDAEGSLAGAVGATVGDAGDTGDGTASAPRLGEDLMAGTELDPSVAMSLSRGWTLKRGRLRRRWQPLRWGERVGGREARVLEWVEEEELKEEPPRSKHETRSLLLRLPPPPGLELRTGCSDCIPHRRSSLRAVVRSHGRLTPMSRGEERAGLWEWVTKAWFSAGVMATVKDGNERGNHGFLSWYKRPGGGGGVGRCVEDGGRRRRTALP